MVIQIDANMLTFVTLTDEQREKVMQLGEGLNVSETTKGLRVAGAPGQLFTILHRLAFTYDIEIV